MATPGNNGTFAPDQMNRASDTIIEAVKRVGNTAATEIETARRAFREAYEEHDMLLSKLEQYIKDETNQRLADLNRFLSDMHTFVTEKAVKPIEPNDDGREVPAFVKRNGT